MSTHDMNIANQSFPNFRTDLNNALAALVSNSSSTTEPATTFAHQYWVDTSSTPSVLKIRNAANDAWVTIGSIDESNNTFSINIDNATFAGDVTIGNASGDTLTINGTAVTTPNGLNFDSNTFVIDAANNSVGIGTSSPVYNLDVSAASDTGFGIRNSSSVTSGNRGTINWLNSSASSVAYIRAGAVTDNVGTNLQFAVRPAAGSLTEAMRIDSSGNVGIGTSSPAVPLHVYKTSGRNDYRIASGSSSGEVASVQFYGTDSGSAAQNYAQIIGGITTNTAGSEAGYLSFETVGSGSVSERMRLDSSGNVLFGKTASGYTVYGGQYSAGSFHSASANDFMNCYSTTGGAYRFFVSNAGTVYATYTTISGISDQRLKENIRDLDVGLDAVMQLRPRKFDWKEGKGQDTKDCRGFIAQEFEQVFPDLIDEWKDPAPEGEEPYKSVRQDLIPVLVKAIQELKAENDALKSRLDAAGL